MKKIVVDIYGADAGVKPILSGIVKTINKYDDFFPVIVGDESIIIPFMEDNHISSARYEVIHTNDFIGHNEPASCIFNGRDNSSMALAYNRLKKDEDCFAMLSPGSTGSLLVGSICRLGLIKGLKFPALLSALPCAGEKLLCLVDCGANVECSSNDLVRFAIMGDVFCKCYCGIENPRVGLMSVGKEKQKGTALVKETYDRLEQLPINFIGNLEGSDMVSGCADVVVTDGFSGNLLLKCTEASGKAALQTIQDLKLVKDEETLEKIKTAIIKRFDFNSRGAATFLGPSKIVVKMHGIANEDTVLASVEQILKLKKADFSNAVSKALASK